MLYKHERLIVFAFICNVLQSFLDAIKSDFETLIFMPTVDLQHLMKKVGLDEELQRRVFESTRNFNTYIECLQVDARTANELDLHWDSWDQQNQLSIDRHSSASFGVPSYPRAADLSNFRSCPTSPPIHISTLDTNSNTWSSSINSNLSNNYNQSSSRSASPLLATRKDYDSRRYIPPTPPNHHKVPPGAMSAADSNNLALIKSRSHDDKLTNRVDLENATSLENRRRLATEPAVGRGSPLMFSPIRSPPCTSEMGSDSCFEDSPSAHLIHQPPTTSTYTSCLPPPPRSPRAHGGMMHAIHHRFVSSMKLTSIVCELCKKPMIFGFKCKECKFRCHRECIPKVPPSCGLPSELVTVFRETIIARKAADLPSALITTINRLSPLPFAKDLGPVNILPEPQHTPHMLRKARLNREPIRNQNQTPFGNNPDSSSTSSCNSSNASSPAFKSQSSPQPTIVSQTFTFPETSENAHASLLASNGSHLDLDESGQSGDLSDRAWPRQNSISLREWDIPIDEVKTAEQIGRGRFGTVFKANWHGLVALKIFSVSNFSDADSAIAAFKMEVATLRKTRHDNLVLFMGACMKPPKLAIVTSFCKGDTLHCHVHLRKERFPLSSLVNIAQQIAQGMGYLHARGILHKDLKTSNIFYDPNNSRVTITDFGLFSLTKLCIVDKYVMIFSGYYLLQFQFINSFPFLSFRNNYQLQIPKGWLAYLAPELIRMLRPDSDYENDNLPFSIYTDVYSFG
jgi:kinase suppressor of Ras 2